MPACFFAEEENREDTQTANSAAMQLCTVFPFEEEMLHEEFE